MNQQANTLPVTTANENMLLRFKLSAEDKKAGKESPREALTVSVPVPNEDGAVAILNNGGKGWELLQQAMASIIYVQLRGQVTELIEKDPSVVLTQDLIDLSKLTWDFIANMPPKERAGSAIPKEIWDKFAADYVAIMPALTGKPKETAENAASIFVKKMAPAKTRKDLLPTFKARLDLWLANTSLVAEDADDADQFAALYTLLQSKIDEYLNVDVVLSEDAI